MNHTTKVAEQMIMDKRSQEDIDSFLSSMAEIIVLYYRMIKKL